ncbi:leucyl/phenylalanyl-tRNA--protein transferase [Yoonia sp. R2331]|uniref:leucyl/phenylalanyl-tRNA--protein transferase n=1 Tax=Yoonia sp. R2331 TaxID=3237238 RepID=UPI0034E4384A
MRDDPPLSPELLLQAYRVGVFPMSESRDNPDVFWVDPRQRGILPLPGFHISRSLRKTLNSHRFSVTLNADFRGVLQGCAARPETWINDTIFDLYMSLHMRGNAHAAEVWQDGTLVGGVYGVAIGGAFFGESMFSTATDASKTALAALTHHLHGRGFTLFDTQFMTPHLRSLGALEIPRARYHALLDIALDLNVEIGPPGPLPVP